VWAPPREYLQTMPKGLERPLLAPGVALVVLGALLITASFLGAVFWVAIPGLLLPLFGILLMLIYRDSDGTWQL
jgi:uncharacterized membrane protein HdeD (DUF308 family)